MPPKERLPNSHTYYFFCFRKEHRKHHPFCNASSFSLSIFLDSDENDAEKSVEAFPVLCNAWFLVRVKETQCGEECQNQRPLVATHVVGVSFALENAAEGPCTVSGPGYGRNGVLVTGQRLVTKARCFCINSAL